MRVGKLLGAVLGITVVGVAATFIALPSQPTEVRGARAPLRKVILVTIDTLRADRLGTYGYPKDTSPNIDAWAKKALVFERATVPAPWTAPSMASLITGRYPAETGVYTNRSGLKSNLSSLAETFSAAGVATAWFNTNPVLMLQRPGFRVGFDHFEPSGKLAAKLPYSQLEPAVFAWLDEHANQDFFLWIHNMDPHSPPTEGNPFHESREFLGYEGEVRLVDLSMRRLLDKLQALGIADQVVLVFTADHGEAFSEHQLPGHQNVIYDEVLHVPLIVQYPGMANIGRTDEPVELLDLYRTILDLADLPIPADARGESLVPILESRAQRRSSDYAFHSRYYLEHLGQHHLAVRNRDYKLIAKVPYDVPEGKRHGHLLREKPQWALDQPGLTLELYKYSEDPRETKNLIFNGGDPAVVEELERSLLEWRDSVLGSNVGKTEERVIDESTKETLRKLGYGGD